MKEIELRICTECGKQYSAPPALSRKDSKSLLCPDCGTREALESIGVCRDEQDKILDAIHRSLLR